MKKKSTSKAEKEIMDEKENRSKNSKRSMVCNLQFGVVLGNKQTRSTKVSPHNGWGIKDCL